MLPLFAHSRHIVFPPVLVYGLGAIFGKITAIEPPKISRSISDRADYPLTLEEASRLYQHLFIYSHGMASMVASGIYQFSMEEVIGLLTEVCQSLIKEMVGKK